MGHSHCRKKTLPAAELKMDIIKKEMTLDWCIFSSMLLQPRVISVLSYYLTSLVNLAFYRLFRRCHLSFDPLRCTFQLHFIFLNTLVSENPLCRNSIFGYWLRLFAHVRSQLVSQHPKCFLFVLFFFESALAFDFIDYFQRLHLFCCLRRMST